MEIKSKIAGYISQCQFVLSSISQAKAKRDQGLTALGLLGRSGFLPQLRGLTKDLRRQAYEKEIGQYQNQVNALVQELRSYFAQVSIERRGLSKSGNSHVILKKIVNVQSSSQVESKARKLLSILYTLSEEPLLFTKDIQVRESEQNKTRRSSAYTILNHLEKSIRLLIERELSTISKNWWKERIPDDVRVNAEDRKARNENPWPWHDNSDEPLISYLDFNDYLKVIMKRDNWKDVFGTIFIDRELTSAKFRELDPIRKMIAHNRDLSARDFARLEVDADDLLQAIDKHES